MRPTQGWEARLHQQYRLNQLLPAWAPDAVLAAVLLAGPTGTGLSEWPGIESRGGAPGTERSRERASSPGGPATPPPTPTVPAPSSGTEAGTGGLASRYPGNSGGCPAGPVGGSPGAEEQETLDVEENQGRPARSGSPGTNSTAARVEVGPDASSAAVSGDGKGQWRAGMARQRLSAGRDIHEGTTSGGKTSSFWLLSSLLHWVRWPQLV